MKSIVLLSGGLDSCTALAFAKDVGDDVAGCIGFRYGSRHNDRENAAARKVASHYNVPFWLLDLTGCMGDLKSAIMARNEIPVPQGHYEEESMRQTVVPGRNLILIAVAAANAESIGAGQLYIGTHAGDHFIYPDCRPEFLNAAAAAVRLGSEGKVRLAAPFTNWAKKDIVARGHDLGAPYHLTWTCYAGGLIACGLCGSCQERLDAFARCGLVDPIEYATRQLLPKKKPEDVVERRGTGGVI